MGGHRVGVSSVSAYTAWEKAVIEVKDLAKGCWTMYPKTTGRKKQPLVLSNGKKVAPWERVRKVMVQAQPLTADELTVSPKRRRQVIVARNGDRLEAQYRE
jgi:hypothetical protein